MRIIPAKFQPSRTKGVGGDRGDRRTRDVTLIFPRTLWEFLPPPSLRSGGIISLLGKWSWGFKCIGKYSIKSSFSLTFEHRYQFDLWLASVVFHNWLVSIWITFTSFCLSYQGNVNLPAHLIWTIDQIYMFILMEWN